MSNIKFEEVQGLLDDGKEPEEVFNWVDWDAEGFRVVELDGKHNYLDENNKILSPDLWFDIANSFRYKLGVVTLNGKDNYIKPDGTLLFEHWFDNCHKFYEGFAVVNNDYKWNYINEKGKFLSDTWFDYCSGFNNGLGMVTLKDKCNLIKPDGTLLSEQWFDEPPLYDNNGILEAKIGGKQYVINKNGEPLENDKLLLGK